MEITFFLLIIIAVITAILVLIEILKKDEITKKISKENINQNNMKICSRCKKLYEPAVKDLGFCFECLDLEFPCKRCGESGLGAFMSKDGICVRCNILSGENKKITEENLTKLSKENQLDNSTKPILENNIQKNNFDWNIIFSYLITFLIFAFFAYVVWFFASGQSWCKDGTNNCIESAPAQEERDAYAPFDL